MSFYGRKREIALLRSLYASQRYEGVLVYGRRRIGKSELIKESLKGMNLRVIHYQCISVSEKMNTERFSEVLSLNFDIPKPSFSSFDEALSFVFAKAREESIVLVLDEYPLLRRNMVGADSRLQKVIDENKEFSRLKMILCGSYLDIMEKLSEEENPLYGRLPHRILVEPLDYLDAAKFCPNYSLEDRIKVYSFCGGVPYYLEQIIPSLSVEENIARLFLSDNAILTNEIRYGTLNEVGKMRGGLEVILAIAKGKKKFSQILSSCSITSPSLADVLEKLLSMRIVRKVFPLNDVQYKKAYYEIADRASLFYFSYVFPRESFLAAMDSVAFYSHFVEKDFLEEYIPHFFEDVAREYLVRANKAGRLDPLLYKIGKYFYDDPKTKTNGEFDVVTLHEGGYDFYEVKWSKNPIDDHVVNEEIAQLTRHDIAYANLGFISRSGFDLKEHKDAPFHKITLKDMFIEE